MTDGHLTQEQLERVVEEALDSLPKRFADLVHNVAIATEDEPSDEDLDSLDDDPDDDSELLGIYRGVALTERSHDAPAYPTRSRFFAGRSTALRTRAARPCAKCAKR
jgi:predicted Zn-dependent protease with MMP-like domain